MAGQHSDCHQVDDARLQKPVLPGVSQVVEAILDPELLLPAQEAAVGGVHGPGSDGSVGLTAPCGSEDRARGILLGEPLDDVKSGRGQVDDTVKPLALGLLDGEDNPLVVGIEVPGLDDTSLLRASPAFPTEHEHVTPLLVLRALKHGSVVLLGHGVLPLGRRGLLDVLRGIRVGVLLLHSPPKAAMSGPPCSVLRGIRPLVVRVNPFLDMIGLEVGKLERRRDEIDEGLQMTLIPLVGTCGLALDEVEEAVNQLNDGAGNGTLGLCNELAEDTPRSPFGRSEELKMAPDPGVIARPSLALGAFLFPRFRCSCHDVFYAYSMRKASDVI